MARFVVRRRFNHRTDSLSSEDSGSNPWERKRDDPNRNRSERGHRKRSSKRNHATGTNASQRA